MKPSVRKGATRILVTLPNQLIDKLNSYHIYISKSQILQSGALLWLDKYYQPDTKSDEMISDAINLWYEQKSEKIKMSRVLITLPIPLIEKLNTLSSKLTKSQILHVSALLWLENERVIENLKTYDTSDLNLELSSDALKILHSSDELSPSEIITNALTLWNDTKKGS